MIRKRKGNWCDKQSNKKCKNKGDGESIRIRIRNLLIWAESGINKNNERVINLRNKRV